MSVNIHVAVGVITSASLVLISKRLASAHQGDKWEFPGGKVESGEGVESALCRELEEELGIQPVDFEPLIRVSHEYETCSVLLDVWRVTSFKGSPAGLEGQEIAWVTINELSTLDFPAANAPIVELVLKMDLSKNFL